MPDALAHPLKGDQSAVYRFNRREIVDLERLILRPSCFVCVVRKGLIKSTLKLSWAIRSSATYNLGELGPDHELSVMLFSPRGDYRRRTSHGFPRGAPWIIIFKDIKAGIGIFLDVISLRIVINFTLYFLFSCLSWMRSLLFLNNARGEMQDICEYLCLLCL